MYDRISTILTVFLALYCFFSSVESTIVLYWAEHVTLTVAGARQQTCDVWGRRAAILPTLFLRQGVVVDGVLQRGEETTVETLDNTNKVEFNVIYCYIYGH